MTTPLSHEIRTSLTVSATAECPFVTAEEHAVEYLSDAEAGGPNATIRIPWLPWLRHRVDMTFGQHFDIVGTGGAHDEVRIRWTSGSPWLPDLRGILSFKPTGDKTIVVLEASYVAPLGPAGIAFDRLLGKHLARASLVDLAERIAAHMGHCQRAWISAARTAER